MAFGVPDPAPRIAAEFGAAWDGIAWRIFRRKGTQSTTSYTMSWLQTDCLCQLETAPGSGCGPTQPPATTQPPTIERYLDSTLYLHTQVRHATTSYSASKMEFSAVYNHPGSTSGNVYNSNLGTANTFSIAAGTLGTVEAYTTWGTTIPSLVGTNSGVVIRVQFDAKDYQNASVNWATESDWCTGTGCNDSSGNGASGVFINGTNERIGSCNSVHYVSQSNVPNPTVIYDFTFEYIVLPTYTSIGFVIGMQFGSSYTLATVN